MVSKSARIVLGPFSAPCLAKRPQQGSNWVPTGLQPGSNRELHRKFHRSFRGASSFLSKKRNNTTPKTHQHLKQVCQKRSNMSPSRCQKTLKIHAKLVAKKMRKIRTFVFLHGKIIQTHCKIPYIFEGVRRCVRKRKVMPKTLEMTSNSMPQSVQKLYKWQAPESSTKQVERSPK